MNFRKKTTPFEAIQWTGDNDYEVRQFVGKQAFWMPPNTPDGTVHTLCINQVGGYREIRIGEWVVQSGPGVFLMISDEDFKRAYEPA